MKKVRSERTSSPPVEQRLSFLSSILALATSAFTYTAFGVKKKVRTRLNYQLAYPPASACLVLLVDSDKYAATVIYFIFLGFSYSTTNISSLRINVRAVVPRQIALLTVAAINSLPDEPFHNFM